MRACNFTVSLATAVLFAACSGSPKQPATPAPTGSASEAVAGSAAPEGSQSAAAPVVESNAVPTSCAGGSSNPCVMPIGFVKKMCSAIRPDLAMALFAKEAPWTHAYVAVKQADAFNGFSGPATDQKLTLDEELLILLERKPDTGGMQVSGVGASYDLLRWDGSCVTLSAQEVTMRKPPQAKTSTITWRNLDEATQNALMQDAKIAKAAAERKKECKGATIGDVTAKCEKADRALQNLVAEGVRSGSAKVRAPQNLP